MENLTGKKFNKLTVVEFSHKQGNRIYWKCLCNCGNEYTTRADSLKSGHAKSCGCHKRESLKNCPRHIIHGERNSRLYRIWTEIFTRCNNTRNANYKNYGARGITICDEWKDFQTFYDWAISNGYSDGLTVDRIDNDKGYSPDNCRWATIKEQCNNRRTNRVYELNGEKLNIAQIAEKYNLDYQLIWGRLRKGWSIQRAIQPKYSNGI